MSWIQSLVGGGGGSGSAPAQLHDTTHSPVSLWQFDGDLTDSQAVDDLSKVDGVERYGPSAIPGAIQALFCDGVSRFVGADPAPAALRITGSMTVEVLVYPIIIQTAASSVASIASVTGDNASEATNENKLWQVSLLANSNAGLARWEKAAGADVTHTTASDPGDPFGHFTPNRWHHLAQTRDTSGGAGATISKWYINGQLVATDTTLDPPTDGANAEMMVGATLGGSNSNYLGMVSSLKVIASVLTTPQILAEAQRTLPPNVRP